MNPYHPYAIFPLGDRGLVIDFGNRIEEAVNKKVLQLYNHLKVRSHHWIMDFVPAYSSLTIYYDVYGVCQKKAEGKTAFETMADIVEDLINGEGPTLEKQARLIEVPVCYSEKFAVDIEYISRQKNIHVEEIIHLHTSRTYRVFMIGFLPGFAYMGQVDERIAIPRKQQPQNVVAGAIGIAGSQTGIYPLDSPGGWQIIGQTPMKLFNKNKSRPVLLEPVDEIKFYSITEDEFENYQTGPT